MKNKKRLAVLAMSAVMAMTSMPFSAFAADFSAGEGVEEAVVAESADAAAESLDVETEEADAAGVKVTSVKWNVNEKDLTASTVTLSLEDDPDGEESITRTVTDVIETKPASCANGTTGYFVYYFEPLDKTFSSKDNNVYYQLDDQLDHDFSDTETTWVTYDDNGNLVKTTAPKCGESGLRASRKICSECGAAESKYFDANTKKESKREHSFDDNKIVKYTNLINIAFIGGEYSDDKLTHIGGTPYLTDTDANGYYTVTVYQKCTECGAEEVTKKAETVTVPAKKIASRRVVYDSNISGVYEDGEINSFEGSYSLTKSLPDNADIVLTNCKTKGTYKVEDLDKNGNVITTETVTVPAHHVYGTTDGYAWVKTVNAKDSNLLDVTYDKKTKSWVVTSKTCEKDVQYYLYQKCVNEDKTTKSAKMTATKSNTAHIIDTDVKENVQNYKNKDNHMPAEDVNYIIKNYKNVKVVPETDVCENSGTVTFEFYCSVCGKKAASISGVKVEKLGHQTPYATKQENVKDATCDKAGSYDLVTYCERCGKVMSTTKVTGKRLPHTNEKVVDDKNVAIHDDDTLGTLSISFGGSYVYGPYTAGEKITSNQIGSSTGTLYADVYTTCTTCGKNRVQLGVAKYDYSADGKTVESINGVAVQFEILSVTDETYNTKGEVTGPGSIKVKATYTASDGKVVSAETTVPYYSDVMTAYKERELVKGTDGVWRCYLNDKFQDDYTGLVDYEMNQFYVENGIMTGVNGLTQIDDAWYYLASGRVVSEYTGAVPYNGSWFYVKNGKLDTTMTGLLPYDGGTFLFIGGQIQTGVKGLWQNIDGSGDWFYLADGQVLTAYTGVVFYDGAAFYVEKGKLAKDYNGTVEYEGLTFKVIGGQLYGQVK